MMQNQYLDAFLEIITRYNRVYRKEMDVTDLNTVERLVSSGMGFWESGEKDQKYYLFPCPFETK
tara:strand:- start:925 stop:1116 length:192 start_codon:yes stop_codon:yes gene_type:complete